MGRDGRIFPLKDDIYQCDSDEGSMKMVSSIKKKETALNNNPVKGKRQDLHKYILEAEDPISVSSSAR